MLDIKKIRNNSDKILKGIFIELNLLKYARRACISGNVFSRPFYLQMYQYFGTINKEYRITNLSLVWVAASSRSFFLPDLFIFWSINLTPEIISCFFMRMRSRILDCGHRQIAVNVTSSPSAALLLGICYANEK